jgi:hypothetical protein
MNEIPSQQYDEEEVDRIMRRALKINSENAIKHEDLIETARAFGLDSQIVEAAIEQEQRELKKERVRKTLLKRRKMYFYRRLGSYLIVIGALFLINAITPGPWWFQWPALGWGIGLAFQFKAMFFTGSKRLERIIEKKHAERSPRLCEQ